MLGGGVSWEDEKKEALSSTSLQYSLYPAR